MRETWVRSLCWEDPLEKGKATNSSILAWRISWTIVHGITKSWTWLSHFHFHFSLFILKSVRGLDSKSRGHPGNRFYWHWGYLHHVLGTWEEVSLKVERRVMTMKMNLKACMGLQAEGLAFAKKQDAWKEMQLVVGTVESFEEGLTQTFLSTTPLDCSSPWP